MVSQLFDPREPKNVSDLIVISVLAFHIAALFVLPQGYRKPILGLTFLVWRAAYNVGIGYLLKVQSNHRRLVAWAKRYQLFVPESQSPRPWLHRLLKRELETKIREDYRFEDAPIEYNTWLVFRKLVDLILMCDFVSYALFAAACAETPANEQKIMTMARLGAGGLLVALNLFIKLDAHRVVGDYAWYGDFMRTILCLTLNRYWGDFFYLVEADLTFDSVFLMAPHPMYSIGYIGYYGISMIVASYSVLAISVVAHAAQFAFLIFVETPHIDRIYNPPKKRTQSGTEEREHHTPYLEPSLHRSLISESAPSRRQPTAAHNLMGFHNFDFFRVTDIAVAIAVTQGFFLTALTPSTTSFQVGFVLNAIVWRLLFSLGLGIVLRKQSLEKSWTAHYLKHGQSIQDAWLQWKSVYHICMIMCHGSFMAAAWKLYTCPTDWSHGFALLRHVIGGFLVALQIWTVVSIYESLGEFGFYMGDFFFDPPKLTYDGIYRFLNNPERVLGLSGFYGVAVITGSKAMLALALLSHLVSLAFIQWVEAPHMRKYYGKSIRQEAGITIGLKTAVPKHIHGSVERVIQETSHVIEDFFENALPGVTSIVGDLFKHQKAESPVVASPARITITRNDYSISIIEPRPNSALPGTDDDLSRRSTVQGSTKLWNDSYRPTTFEYGAPVSISWVAPANHSQRDWIGLYMVADNKSREVTRVSSAGRWTWIVPDEYEDSSAIQSSNVAVDSSDGQQLVKGEVVFQGDRLFWESGVYEFRLHHGGKHNVMAMSLPFEIKLNRCDAEDVDEIEEVRWPLNQETSHPFADIFQILLPAVRNSFDRDADIAPSNATESFGPLVKRDSKYAKRVIYAIHQLFGIEFAPQVVLADGNVKNLAWRICNAKKVLVSSLPLPRLPLTDRARQAPYSMASRGTTTPVSEET